MESGIGEHNARGVATRRQIALVSLYDCSECSRAALWSHRSGRGGATTHWSWSCNSNWCINGGARGLWRCRPMGLLPLGCHSMTSSLVAKL